jgi:hypothetical protein
VVEQDWPDEAQVAGWQVPLVDPDGTAQEVPVQQSALLVQTSPVPWQTTGTAQTPPEQISEQHWALLVQAMPLDLHAWVPASAGSWQTVVSSSLARQDPAQHVLAPVQAAPRGVHALAVHFSLPVESGVQGMPLQHWSLNWQSWPAAMQQPAWPVYPVGQAVLPPPKHRGIPELSSLQASFCPSQQAWEALTLKVPPSGKGKGAPQILPTGLHFCPLLQRPNGSPAWSLMHATVPLGLVPPPQQDWASKQVFPVIRQPVAGRQIFAPVPGSAQTREQQVVPLEHGMPSWTQPPERTSQKPGEPSFLEQDREQQSTSP